MVGWTADGELCSGGDLYRLPRSGGQGGPGVGAAVCSECTRPVRSRLTL